MLLRLSCLRPVIPFFRQTGTVGCIWVWDNSRTCPPVREYGVEFQGEIKEPQRGHREVSILRIIIIIIIIIIINIVRGETAYLKTDKGVSCTQSETSFYLCFARQPRHVVEGVVITDCTRDSGRYGGVVKMWSIYIERAGSRDRG